MCVGACSSAPAGVVKRRSYKALKPEANRLKPTGWKARATS
jgi:hypothetical protein